MRWFQAILPAVGLAACAVGTGETSGAADAARAAQVNACTAAVAAHVGKPTDAVVAEWTGATTTAGTAVVTVRDDQGGGRERVHTCEVDAGGRVLAIRHPGA